MEEGGAWINIADVLNLVGRTEEALEAARQGLEIAHTRDWRTTDWLRLAVSEMSFHLGDWAGAEAAIPASSRRHTGGTLPLLAELHARSSRSAAATSMPPRRRSRRSAERTAELTEPQFIGTYGMLSAELARRGGDIGRRPRR